MRRPLGAIIIMIGAVALGGCADKGLHRIQSQGTGPDEFLILPNKPLTAPKDYAVLPAPTPGGRNLVDQNPISDAVVALGGNASALELKGVPASDGALVTQASRYGVPVDTRVTLAEEDAKFRKRQGRLSSIRLFKVDRYEQAYRRQALEPFSETRRFRNAGASTPTSRPQSE